MAAAAISVVMEREARARPGQLQRWAAEGSGSISTGAHPEFRLALNDTQSGVPSPVSNLYWAVLECEFLVVPGDADDADEVQLPKLTVVSGDWASDAKGTRNVRYLDAVRVQSNVSSYSAGLYRLPWPVYCGRPRAGARGRLVVDVQDTSGFVSTASSSVSVRLSGLVHDKPFSVERTMV